MRYFLITVVLFFINAVLMAAAYFFVSKQIDRKSLAVLQAQQEITRFGYVGSQSNLQFSTGNVLQAKEELIAQLGKERGLKSQLLIDIASVIPKEVWLTELLQTGQSVTLSGYAMSNDKLAIFIGELGENPAFSSISLASTKPQQINHANVYQFRLICLLGGQNDG